MRARTSEHGAAALAAALRAQGGTLAALALADGLASERGGGPGQAGSARPGRVQVAGGSRPGPAQLAAAGPRAHANDAEYELLVEMILEGSRLHYGGPRVIQTEDPDLALLLGDQLYALGLARLAALGDLEAVAELADVISLVAQAHAASDEALAEAVWEAGAVAVGWGWDGEHAAAKELARAGAADARDALLSIARRWSS